MTWAVEPELARLECCGEAPVTENSRVLLVDDDEIFGAATAKLLSGAGLEVTAVPDYRQALEIIESDAVIDLLLTDIVMPNRINGLALARMARLRRPRLKVIYLSGYDIPQINKEALGPVFCKPVEEQVLIDEIRRLLADD
jgi:CheY-like chemotaxis protein